jgi:hypothetical protein
MRPGIPGALQLNPDKVRLMSNWMGRFRPPKIGNIYPRPMGPQGMMGGQGLGLPGAKMGMGMPKLDLRGGLR